MPKIILNRKYIPLLSSNSRYFIITGSRGSAKSFSVTSYLVMLMLAESGHTILFTRYSMRSAHISIFPEFIDKIDILGVQDKFSITKDSIICLTTGSKIIFRGIKTSSGMQTANLKSLQGVTTWVLDESEELMEESIFDKINLSIRTKGRQNRVILLLNPATKTHWIYQRFFQDAGVEPGSNLIKGNTTYIHGTYLDNIKHLDDSFITEANTMMERNRDKYEHIMLGGWLDKAEGVVITNWEYGEFNPNNLQVVYGQDYGFSIDPTTLVGVAIDRTKKIIYVKEHLYKPKLTTSDIATINIQVAGYNMIVADSAEPRLIDELRNRGCNIIGADKGPGSISAGIALLQDYKIIVDPESINIAKELNNFSYADKASKLFIDNWNHCIDPIRYVVTFMIGGNNGLYSF